MNIASKGYFIGMEVIEARSADYLARIISQDVYNRSAVDVLISYQFLGELNGHSYSEANKMLASGVRSVNLMLSD